MNIFETIYTNLIKFINRPLSKVIIPEKEYKDVKDLNLNEIEEWKSKYGIGGIILDIDGTIRQDFKDVDYRNIKWILRLKKEFKICIVSNGNDKKIKKLAAKMKIKYFSNSFKPRRKAFTKAANEMGLDPENILVIGDEYLSDVLGGQRSCMWTAVVGEKNFRNQLKVSINQDEKYVKNQSKEKDNVEIRY